MYWEKAIIIGSKKLVAVSQQKKACCSTSILDIQLVLLKHIIHTFSCILRRKIKSELFVGVHYEPETTLLFYLFNFICAENK
jgi:hypothetical protein